jgi:tetratricopeptide (TPR) repeat protein
MLPLSLVLLLLTDPVFSGSPDPSTSTFALAADNEGPASKETSESSPGGPETRRRENSGLTSDLIYSTLVAEVASQRGDQRMAFTHFLHAARLALDAGLAERATRAAVALKDGEAIQRAIDTWLELAPDAMTAHQIAAYVRLEADDTAGAMVHLRRIVSLAAERGEDGFMQAARLVNKLNPADRRLGLMETLTADEPENADAWFARALVAAGADRFDQSREAARRAAELRPGWNEPRIFLVQVLLSQGERAEARSTLEAFVDEDPEDHGLRMLYAQLLVDEKEFARARDAFEYMLRDKPKEPDVLFALGILSLQLEDMEAARDYFTRLRETGKRQDDSAYYLGQSAELADDLEAAVSWYRKVEGEHGLDAQIRIARIRAEQGAVERGREILQQLRDQWPDDAVTLYLVEAEILRDLDRPREAMAVYDKALVSHPQTPDLLYARALHAASLNRLEILERDLKSIIDKDPEHADALNALGYSLADLTDRYQEALGYIERALTLKPEDPAVLDSMGWVQYRLGNLEESVTYLRKALSLMPDGEIAAHLGEVLWALGRRDEAWSIWEEALERDPQHTYLLRVIGRHRVTSSSPEP